MAQIMTHLVANYPNPSTFLACFKAMLDQKVDYLEIQLPFSNPMADGPLIYEANIQALEYKSDLLSVLDSLGQIYDPKIHSTKLFLMSYLTPIQAFGFEKVVNLLQKSHFHGLILPDLSFGSPEQVKLQSLTKALEMALMPVLPLNISSNRLAKIISTLESDQLIYFIARNGKTGPKTEVLELQTRLQELRQQYPDFKLALGFGIQNSTQVQQINQSDFIAVIGSEIIRQIQASKPNQEYLTITNFLQNLN